MTPLNLAILAVHGVMIYAWMIFPALLAWLARRKPEPAAGGGIPPVAFILSAYNEESHIAARVRNLIAMDYPADRWRAFVGVDGSRDRTAAEALTAADGHPNIQVLDFAENRGKVAVLKDLAGRVRRDAPGTEILIFTDANTEFAPEALRLLVAPLADPAVGGVCGKLVFVQPAGGKTDENVYWKLENLLKLWESALDSCLGANGAIYAVRAPLFWSAIPSNTIVDDFVIGMKVREQGYRMIYEPRAIATEELPPEIRHEWKRRVRIGAGDYQAVLLCRRCLGPSYGAFAWAFWSHKVLRWFTPHLMLIGIALAAAGAASEHPVIGVMVLGLYAAFAAAALLGSVLERHTGSAVRLLRGIQYLLAMQAALFAGFLRFCRGNLEGRWQRTAR
jgi:cellulose synthase/poly-beta-1,6-N-acetylglucosamine synthase-like glycosyltransferase